MEEQDFGKLLSKYADVIVQIGLGLRKDQVLFIDGILEDAPLIREVAKSAYLAGAKYVDVSLSDEHLVRARYEYIAPENLTYIPDWIFSRYEEYYKNGDAYLWIASGNPDLLESIDSDLITKSRKASMEKYNPLRKYVDHYNWCVAATATPTWAKKVFPGTSIENAQASLWGAIFQVCRIDQPDPVNAWKKHIVKLTKFKEYLNNKQYASLHYKAPDTDMTVGLPKTHIWSGARETFKNGTIGTPNIPTEEVFTSPHREKVNGYVSSTLPLNLLGRVIEDFVVTFENGRATNITAKKGENDIRKMIEMDENASRLGEISLVSNSSPIRQSGIIFYNTLFDENATCHIAFGNAFRNCIQGGDNMTDDEFEAAGGNKSMIHTDFMIGSPQMDIDGIRDDGTREAVMRQGEWAFDV